MASVRFNSYGVEKFGEFQVSLEIPCHVQAPEGVQAYHVEAEALLARLDVPPEVLLGLGNTAFEAIRKSPAVCKVFPRVFVDDVAWASEVIRPGILDEAAVMIGEAGRFAQAVGDRALQLGYQDYGESIKRYDALSESEARCVGTAQWLVTALRYWAGKYPDRFNIEKTQGGSYLIDNSKTEGSRGWKIRLTGKGGDPEEPSCVMLDLAMQGMNLVGGVNVIYLPDGYYKDLQETSVRGALDLAEEFDISYRYSEDRRCSWDGIVDPWPLLLSNAHQAVRGYYSGTVEITDITRWNDSCRTRHVEDLLRYAHRFGPSPVLKDNEVPDGGVISYPRTSPRNHTRTLFGTSPSLPRL